MATADPSAGTHEHRGSGDLPDGIGDDDTSVGGHAETEGGADRPEGCNLAC